MRDYNLSGNVQGELQGSTACNRTEQALCIGWSRGQELDVSTTNLRRHVNIKPHWCRPTNRKGSGDARLNRC